MIEESAKVLAIHGTKLDLQAQPSSACGGCQARSACGQGLLSKYFNQQPGHITIENRLPSGEPLNLFPGDEVVIGIQEGTVLAGAFYAYLLPLLFVIFFAGMAEFLQIQSELQQILITLSGLFVGIATTKYFIKGEQKYLKQVLPVLLRKGETPLQKISIKQI